MEMIKSILDKVKAFRAVRGYSQEYMASKLGCDYSTYGKIENGHSKLTVQRMFQIAEILDVKPMQLFDNVMTNSPLGEENGQPKIIIELPFSEAGIENDFIKNILNGMLKQYENA